MLTVEKLVALAAGCNEKCCTFIFFQVKVWFNISYIITIITPFPYTFLVRVYASKILSSDMYALVARRLCQLVYILYGLYWAPDKVIIHKTKRFNLIFFLLFNPTPYPLFFFSQYTLLFVTFFVPRKMRQKALSVVGIRTVNIIFYICTQ